MTLSTIPTLLVVVLSYKGGSSQQQYNIVYMNSSNKHSCWIDGAQLPCQTILQALKEIQTDSEVANSVAQETVSNFHQYQILDLQAA